MKNLLLLILTILVLGLLWVMNYQASQFRIYIINSFRLIRVVNNLKKYQEALECYDKSIAINPTDSITWSNKGFSLILYYINMVLHKLSKYPDAIKCFEKSLQIKINPIDFQNKAESLKLSHQIFHIFELGKISEAKKFYLAAFEQGSCNQDQIQGKLFMLQSL